MVDVNTQNKTISVNVSSSGVSSNVNASGDTTMYYSNKAREWAISNRIVDGVDYSSKYYAGKANESALNAQSFAQSAQDSYNNFQQSVDGALSNIGSSVQGGIDEINNTKTTILNDIEFVAEGEKKEIEDLIDNGKEELRESIGDVKVLTTLAIGDIGFTQMAIDESKGKRRILNGQLIIQEQYVQFTNIIKESVALNPSLACAESEWQTEVTMNTFGLCGKFVIDDEGGTIRLPKYPNYFIAGLANIAPVVGNGMSLGLTDGTNNFGLNLSSYGNNPLAGTRMGAYDTNIGTSITSTLSFTNNKSIGVTTDPTKSGIEAQIDEKQIAGTYFIQVATGAETEDNIINEIELNNPFSLLDYKFSEYELNNLSWLRSNGQYNSKAVYPAVYELLLKIYNGAETKAGVSVKLHTEDYTDEDFVINQDDETFRLQLKVKLASGKAVVGNGMTLGLTDGTLNYGMQISNATANSLRGLLSTGNYGTTTGTIFNSNTASNVTKTVGITTDPNYSGLELSDSDLYLYFYVGETVQNANLINAGRIEEIVATRTDKVQASLASMPSNKYVALTLGASTSSYTAPANGWFSLGGLDTIGAVSNYGFVMRRGDRFGLESRIGNTAMTTGWCNGILPVRKGDVVRIYHNMDVADSQFRFFYAQGEV